MVYICVLGFNLERLLWDIRDECVCVHMCICVYLCMRQCMQDALVI